MYRGGNKGRQSSRMAGGGPRFISSARAGGEQEAIARAERMNALAMSASLGAASGELRIAPSAIPLLTQRSSAAKRGGRRTIPQQAADGPLAPEFRVTLLGGGAGPRPAASAHFQRGGLGAAKPEESQESRAAPRRSANQGFRQLLSRRNMLSMQDQREESKNLAKWLNQRNAMGKHSVKRTGTSSSGWLQASLPVPAFTLEQSAEVPSPCPQAVAVPASVAAEKQISTARAAPIGFNKMRFSDATDIQTQYPAGAEEQRNEASVITPVDTQAANPASARTSAVLQPQPATETRDAAPWRQLRQRTGHGTLEPTESQGPQYSASSGARLLTQSFFQTQNFVMGFQPILQNKVVGPYIKGPIYVEDRARKGKGSQDPRYNSLRPRKKQSRFQLLQVGTSDDGGLEGEPGAAATIPADDAKPLQADWQASKKQKPRVVTGRDKRLQLTRGSRAGSRVQSPPDTGVSRGVLPATLGADGSPTPGTDREEAQSRHSPGGNPEVAEQADAKELSSEHRQSPRQPTDQQSRTILSKKSGQITFDITRGDPIGRESPAVGASALRQALRSSQLRAMLTKEDLVLLNKLPPDQKSKMIEYLNSVFASRVDQVDRSRVDSGARLSPGPALARSDGLSGLAQLAQLAQIAQIMQLAELARSGQSDQDDLPELTLSASQVSILSDLTQSALNQEKKLLQDVAQVIGEAERSLMPLTRRNRLIQSGTLRGKDPRSFQAREVDKFQNILQNKMESFKASMRRQMELQRHVLIEGLHKRVKAGKEGFQQIRIESLSPDNIWRLSQILRVQKENYEKSLEFHNMMEGLKQASQGPPQTAEALSQSLQSSTWRKSAKKDVQREATLITIPSGEAAEPKPGKPPAAPEQRTGSRNGRVASPPTVEFDNTLQPSGGPCSDKGAASPGRACLAPSQLKQLSASSERDLRAMLHNNTFDSHGIKNFSEGMPNGHQMEHEPVLSPPANAKLQTKDETGEDDEAKNIRPQNEDLRILGQHEEVGVADLGHRTIAPSLVSGSAHVKKRDLIGSSRDPTQLLPQSARTAAVPVMDTKRTPVVIPTTGDQSNLEQGGDVSSSFHRFEHGNTSFVRVDAFDDMKDELKLLWPPKQAPEKDLKHKTMKPRSKVVGSTNAVFLNKHSKSYQSQVNLRQQSIRRANQQNSLGLVRQLSPQVAKLDSHVVQGESAKLFAPSGQRTGARRGMASGRTQGQPGASPDSNVAQKHVMQRVMTAPGELDAKFQSIQPASAVYVNLKTPITQRLSRTAQQRMRNMQNVRRATQMNRGEKDRQQQDSQGISIVHQKLLSPRASWMKIQQSGRGSLITSSRTRRLPSGDNEDEKVTKEQLPPLMMNSRAQLKVNNCLKSIESEKLDPRMVDNYELQVETQRIDKETPFGQRGAAPAKKSQSTSKVAQVSKLDSKISQNNKLEGNLLLGQGLGRTVVKAATNIVASDDSNNNEMLNLPGRPSQAEPALDSCGGVKSAQNVKKDQSMRTAARGGHTELLRGDSLTLRDDGSPMSYNVADQRLDGKLKTMKMQTTQAHSRTSKPQGKGVMTPENGRPETGQQSSQVRMPRVVYQQSKNNEYELLSPGSSAWPEESDGTIQGLLNTGWRPAASPKEQDFLHTGATEGGGPPLNVSGEPHNIQNMLYLYEKKTPGKSGQRLSHRACQSVAHSNQNASPIKEYNTDIVDALNKKQEESSRRSRQRPSGGQPAQATETHEPELQPKNGDGEAAGVSGRRHQRTQEVVNQKTKSHSITHVAALSPEEHQELRARDGQGSEQIARTSPPLQQGSDKISNSMNMTIDHFDNLPQTRPPPRLAANNEAFKASAGFMQYIQPFQCSKIPELIREQANDELVSTSRHAEQVDGRVPSSGGHDFIENLIQTMQKEQQIFGEVLGKITSSKNTYSRRSSRDNDQNDFGDLGSAKEAARAHSLEKKLAQQLESLHVSDGTSDPVKLRTTSTEARRRQVLRKTSGPMASAKERKIQRMPTEVKGCGIAPMVPQDGAANERKDPAASGAPSLIVGPGRGFRSLPKDLSSLKASPRGSLDIKDQAKMEESAKNDQNVPAQGLEDNAQHDIVIHTGRVAEPRDEESALSKPGASNPAAQEPTAPRRRTTKSRTGGQQYSSRYRQHHLQKGLVLSQKQMVTSNPYRNRKDDKRRQIQKKAEEVVQSRVQAKVQLDVRGSQKIINGKLQPSSLVIPQALDLGGDSSKKELKAKKVRTQEPAPSFGAFPSRQNNFRIKNAEGWTVPPTQSLSPKHSSAKSVVIGTACRREPILRHLRSGHPQFASKTFSTLPAAARLNVDIGPVGGDLGTPRPPEEADHLATEHPGPLQPAGNHSLHVEVRNEATTGRHSTDNSPREADEAYQEERGPRPDLHKKTAIAVEAQPASNIVSEAGNRGRSSHNVTAYILVQSPQSPSVFDPNAGRAEEDEDKKLLD